MDKKLEIDGALFQALDHFLGQMGKYFYELWLKEGMSLLDIGCSWGWGCLLIEATKKYMEKINLLKTRLQRLNTSEKDNNGVRRKIQKEIRRLEEG